MEDMAQTVANTHGKTLLLFSKCHQQFNSQKKFSPDMLVSLRKCKSIHSGDYKYFSLFLESDIDEFLHHYRMNFPTATITPKLHMMEDHVVSFISLWGVGIGMLRKHHQWCSKAEEHRH
jgi:hypothetical protein